MSLYTEVSPNSLASSSFRPAVSDILPLSQIPVDTTLTRAELNIENQSRTNLLPWKGQFSPQLIEKIIGHYYYSSQHLFDPFAGSGTVLAEAARFNKAATAVELNPAAHLLSRTYTLCSSTVERRHQLIDSVSTKAIIPLCSKTPLFDGVENTVVEPLRLLDAARAMTDEERIVFDAFFVFLDPAHRRRTTSETLLQWRRFSSAVLGLPFTDVPMSAIMADARRVPVGDELADGLITSPPYINVFNYHQQYRRSVEVLGYAPLNIATGEIGSNRKNRSNRYNTVTQYVLEMADVLNEASRILKVGSAMTLVVGRESNVMKTPFYNSEILASVAMTIGLEVSGRQERWFTNRYGSRIYEDILHLRMRSRVIVHDLRLRRLCRQILVNALDRAPTEQRDFLVAAIRDCDAIQKSRIVEV